MRWFALVLAAAACGSSSTPTTPPPTRREIAVPVLRGRPVADGPLTDPTLRRVFALATAALDDPKPPLQGEGAALGKELSSWIEDRTQMIRDLSEAAKQLPSTESMFRAVMLGVALDDFVVDLLTLPAPTVVTKGEFAKDATQLFREALEEHAVAIAAQARVPLATCIELAPSASGALRAWDEHGKARVAALVELDKRVAARVGTQPARPSRPISPPVIKDCAGSEKSQSEPDALPPNLAVKPQLVVRYDGKRVTGADTQKLVAVVSAKLMQDKTITIPFVPAKDVAASDALVAKRKLTPRGPVCGQAPLFTQVLGAKHRNLVVAEIRTDCIVNFIGKKQTCGLSVGFKRAGTYDDAGLPKPYYAPIDSDAPAKGWIAAAADLSTKREEAAVLGGLLGSMAVRKIHYSLRGFGDDDPWMRASETLYSDALTQQLEACVDAPASFDVKLAISPAGKTTGVELNPITAPPAPSKVARCLEGALKSTPWPCTPDGNPAELTGKICMAPK